MQANKKGYILLYVLFLSSFLILFFVSFRGEIEKTLSGVRDSQESVRDISEIQDTLIQLKNKPTTSVSTASNDDLVFDSLIQSGTVFSESL